MKEAVRGEIGAGTHRAQLQPYDFLRDFAEPGGSLEAAVSPRHHASRIADSVRGALEAIGDNLVMLDVVGLGVDDTGDQRTYDQAAEIP